MNERPYKVVVVLHENGVYEHTVFIGPLTQDQANSERDKFNLDPDKDDEKDYAYVCEVPEAELQFLLNAYKAAHGIAETLNPNIGQSDKYFNRSRN